MSEETDVVLFEEFGQLLFSPKPWPCRRCQAPTRLGISLLLEGDGPDRLEFEEDDYYYSLCLECVEHFIGFMLTRLLEDDS